MALVGRLRLAPLLALCLALGGCRAPDPKQELEVLGAEAYWVVDESVGATQYIAPAVRFRVRNKGRQPLSAVEATATFRRRGEEGKSWGGAWHRITAPGQTLGPGAEALVVMTSDGRYYSTGDPESMFKHQLFRDASVEVFLRLGSSNWVSFARLDVPRQVGAAALRALVK